MAPKDEVWKVVGGDGKGGIVVRQGKELSSAQTANRLSTGALVRQIELEGGRLHYARLTGTGPDSGWVSTTLAEKELLVRIAEKPPVAESLSPVLDPAIGSELHVCTWNLLAPCYHRDRSGKKEVQTKFWQSRVEAEMTAIFDAADPDVLCLQEVWMSPTVIKMIEGIAEKRGYRALFCRRTGAKMDGVAVVVRNSRLEILQSEDQEICSMGNRVCLWVLLRLKCKEAQGQIFVLGSTHFTFPHGEEDLQRLQQSKRAQIGGYQFASKHGLDPQLAVQIFAGDLNCPSAASDDDAVEVFIGDGWRSAFEEANGKEATATHCTHRNNHACADLVLLQGPVKAVRAMLLPIDAPDTATIPRPELGGAHGLGTPKTLHDWSQLSDHRPLVTKLSMDPKVLSNNDVGKN